MNQQLRPRPDLHGFPVVLLLGERKVVVVGAGNIATRKVEGLIAGGASNITVIAPQVSDELRAMAAEKMISLEQRAFQEADVNGAYFVTTATEVTEVNRAVFDACEERNIFCNSADDPVNCSTILMSTVRQGDVTIAISTAGKSPAFAKWLRRYLQGRLGPEYGTLIEIVNDERERVQASGASTEDISWDPAFDFSVVQMVREGKLDEVRSIVAQIAGTDPGTRERLPLAEN